MLASLAGRLFDAPERAMIGRFTVHGRLGSGGMGIVYDAYDPGLQRRVAVKVLHQSTQHSRERILREGRAMAQLDHPGVLRVFEVGESGGQVYVVMELAEGGTLDMWLDARPRSIDEILDRFLEAGAGLATAHERGLIHRDIKPHNIFLRADASACVGDFSLVRQLDTGKDTHSEASEDVAPTSAAKTSAYAGTPGYMPPEQARGGIIDARADQYAFCVTLCESICGGRPPPGEPLPPLPRAIRTVLQRGLLAEPDDRFAEMRALLSRLRHYRRRRRRRTRLATGLVATAGVGAALLVASAERTTEEERCFGFADRYAEVWNEARATNVEHAFARTGTAGAQRATRQIRTRLDAYGLAWIGEYRQRCHDTRTQGLRSEQQFTRSVACLTEQLDAVNALVDRFTVADASTVEYALQSLTMLPDPQRCGSLPWLDNEAAQVLPPEDDAAEVRSLGGELHRVRAALWTGHGVSVLGSAEAIYRRAVRLGHAPLTADAGLVFGTLERRLRRSEAAAGHLAESYFAASGIDDRRRACRAAAGLIDLIGVWLGRPEEGRTWLRLAQLADQADPTPWCGGEIRLNAATLLMESAEYDQALAMVDEALAMVHREREGAGPSGSESTEYHRVRMLAQRAMTLVQMGELAAAKEASTLALAAIGSALGPGHPQEGSLRIVLGSALGHSGSLTEARTQFERALEIFDAAAQPDDPRIAQTLSNLVLTLDTEAEYPRARRLLRRARAIYERNSDTDPASERLGFIIGTQGNVAYDHGDFSEALDYFGQAQAIFDRTYGAEHPHSARMRSNSALALDALGRPDEAAADYERSLSGLKATLGEDHAEFVRISKLYAALQARRDGRSDE